MNVGRGRRFAASESRTWSKSIIQQLTLINPRNDLRIWVQWWVIIVNGRREIGHNPSIFGIIRSYVVVCAILLGVPALMIFDSNWLKRPVGCWLFVFKNNIVIFFSDVTRFVLVSWKKKELKFLFSLLMAILVVAGREFTWRNSSKRLL